MAFPGMLVHLLEVRATGVPFERNSHLPSGRWRICSGSSFFRFAAIRDRPETVSIIIENIHQDLRGEDEDGENNTQEENNETALFKNLLTEGFILHNNLEDYAHLFSVDWKDGEGFIDCIAEMAQRFNVDLNWTEQQLEDDLPDQLVRTVYPLFEAAGAVLYSVDTGSDYYTFIIIPQQNTADFEKVSKQYGVPLQRVNKII